MGLSGSRRPCRWGRRRPARGGGGWSGGGVGGAACGRSEGAGWGVVGGRLGGRGFRRAEQGPAGPLLLEVRPHAAGVDLQVWGSTETPVEAVARALEDARRWAGLHDDVVGFAELVDAHPVLR